MKGVLNRMSLLALTLCWITVLVLAAPKKPKPSTGATSGKLEDADNEKRVVGGRRSAPKAWPWVAAIYRVQTDNKTKFICGGAIINSRFILTAAHCIVSGTTGSKIKNKFEVLVGTNQLSVGGKRIEVSRIRLPRDYNASKHYHDIALLRTKFEMKISDTLKTIRLPTDKDANASFTGKSAVVIGWGETGYLEGDFSDHLREATLPIVSYNDCHNKYKSLKMAALPRGVIKSQICAGNGGRDSCRGDSGGPLMINSGGAWKILGIVSFGHDCALAQYPGVYSRVDQFLPWIKAHSNIAA